MSEYVAAAKHWGGDFEYRIQCHQNDRSGAWTNFETEKEVSALPLQNRVCVIDCVTLWLINFFVEYKNDIDKSLDAFKKGNRLVAHNRCYPANSKQRVENGFACRNRSG